MNYQSPFGTSPIQKLRFTISVILCLLCGNLAAQPKQAQWITAPGMANKANTWLAFKKSIFIKKLPSNVTAKIAVDSKYWLWINSRLVVFEGGLKRGPTPTDTYYDQVDLTNFLKLGNNSIQVLVWYFGKDGYSHKSSGQAGLLFDCNTPFFSIVSNKGWQCKILNAYQTAGAPFPNGRLSEASILYNAGADDVSWRTSSTVKMAYAVEMGQEGSAPWNKLIARPIPLFKNFTSKSYESRRVLSSPAYDTVICRLPYNAQVNPYFKIKSLLAGQKITVFTDNYLRYNGGADYIRAEYITRKGTQEFECPGWINGHEVYYIVPKGTKILSLEFRETGYATDFSGKFICNDPFFNKLWEKSRRTLYLTMRDNYMDCPDRERAQWSGDAVNESGETFYALSPSSHQLTKKWLTEIMNWQRPNGILYSPVPSGNWTSELPDQLLATIGYYGLWNYYMNTGDRQTLAQCYEPAKKYLLLWQPDEKGTVKFRSGDWPWGDWGNEKDMELIFDSFYYLALKGMRLAAFTLNKADDLKFFDERMATFKASFNTQFWNGNSYRNPAYKGKTDDRAQALAVVSGLADSSKYSFIIKVLREEEHASPYMEKYVMEALFQMNEGKFGLERQKKRFGRMVNYPGFTTLWEGWNFNDPVYGGGTINHAWSGGGLTILSAYVCGISPLSAGYKMFQILPNPGGLNRATATVSSVSGIITTSFAVIKNHFMLKAKAPHGTFMILGMPASYSRITLNNKIVWQNNSKVNNATIVHDGDKNFIKFKVASGGWKLDGFK
jgi:alpha-L-rhamnosidase